MTEEEYNITDTFVETWFRNAIRQLSGNEPHPDTFEFIKGMYANKDYHNLTHIYVAINEIREFPIGKYDEHCYIVLALIFHDICMDYKPSGSTSVEDSAEIMEECLVDVLTKQQIKIIKNLILATGPRTPQTNAQKLVHDADYSVLGRHHWQSYKYYSELVEKEVLNSTPIGRSIFVGRRINFLRNLLRKTTIFYTRKFGMKYEWQARQNITREISERISGVWYNDTVV